jgi:N utilization substance protein A
VGVRGSRIRNIVDELGGEKIDIVRWNESSQILIANALKPAEVEEVSLCFELGRATIIVREDQLSLAIGRRGQNVRLAARLTGWDIDILTPAEFAKSLEILERTVKSVESVTDEMLDRLGALGMISVFDIEEVGEEVLVGELGDLGMTKPMAKAVVAACAEQARQLAEQQQRDREAAEVQRMEDEAAASAVLGDTTAGGLASGFGMESASIMESDAAADAAAASILGGGSRSSSEAATSPASREPERGES